MSKTVIFRDRQETQAADFNNLGLYQQAALDAVVADAVTDDRRYTGFATTQETATSVRVGVGRLYQAGAVYEALSDSVSNLANHLPLANRRYVAVTVFGQTIETETEPRDFLIDLTTGETEPQAVPMLSLRQAQIAIYGGVESVDPQLPAIADNACLVAVVLMGTTGIISIEAYGPNALPSVEKNSADIADLKAFQTATEPKVSSLTSELAALNVKTSGKAELSAVFDIIRDIARVKDKLGLPANYSAYSSDFFQDTSQLDTALSGLTYKLQDSILFPDAANGTFPLALFNPYDANVTRSATDLVLPKYTSASVLKTEGYAGDISASQYQVQTNTLTAKTSYVYYYRYGWAWNWYNYYYHYRWDLADYYYYNYYDGYYGYWYAQPVTTYVNTVSTTSYNGSLLAQTFLATRAGWVTQLDLFLTKVGANGDVTVAICETTDGKPNLKQTLTRVTVAQAALKKYPTATPFQFPAAFLEAGKRYAFVIITQGDHYVARVDANKFTQGTLFYGSDGDYFQGDLTKDLMFNLYMAKFAAPRTEVMLQNVSVAGGITDIEIAAQQVVPDGTQLTYEIQVAGNWYPLSELEKLATKPDIVPLRAVFLGTNDLAPAIQLGANAITASRPALAVTTYSALRTLAVGEQDFRIDVVAANYDAAKNTLIAQLVDNAGANPVTASLVETLEENADGNAVRKRFTFNLGSPRTTYKIKLTGTRTSDGPPFAITECTDIAY